MSSLTERTKASTLGIHQNRSSDGSNFGGKLLLSYTWLLESDFPAFLTFAGCFMGVQADSAAAAAARIGNGTDLTRS